MWSVPSLMTLSVTLEDGSDPKTFTVTGEAVPAYYAREVETS